MADEPQQDEEPVEEPQAEESAAEEPAAEEPKADESVAEEPKADEPVTGEPQAEEKPKDKGKKGDSSEPAAIPGADLEVDIVAEGEAALPGEEEEADEYAEHIEAEELIEAEEEVVEEPIVATIALAADARYQATGKRKTAVARVTLKPGKGEYLINGKSLDEFFPSDTLRRNIREPLEAVGYEAKMDVVARMHGGGVSAQADALRHGISRALLEADPGLRGALKSRGFLTRDARAKERKKAGLKKARKRPQFSKR
jgi:small subunit ribosomal protein S9